MQASSVGGGFLRQVEFVLSLEDDRAYGVGLMGWKGRGKLCEPGGARYLWAIERYGQMSLNLAFTYLTWVMAATVFVVCPGSSH